MFLRRGPSWLLVMLVISLTLLGAKLFGYAGGSLLLLSPALFPFSLITGLYLRCEIAVPAPGNPGYVVVVTTPVLCLLANANLVAIACEVDLTAEVGILVLSFWCSVAPFDGRISFWKMERYLVSFSGGRAKSSGAGDWPRVGVDCLPN